MTTELSYALPLEREDCGSARSYSSLRYIGAESGNMMQAAIVMQSPSPGVWGCPPRSLLGVGGRDIQDALTLR